MKLLSDILPGNLRNSTNTILRISIGAIFFWFGVVKFFPRVSPAESLAADTICALTFHVISPPACTIVLAVFESLLGILLIIGSFLKPVLILLFLHMLGTMLTFFIFPDLMFAKFPFILTMEGQYVMKNIIILASVLLLWSRDSDQKNISKRPRRPPPS
ncbi:DoxX family protein [Echinicola marina]|uniref:DoxX family protein n=1 Tax=Echinicola marina TaxID=2859768 RepID=UPI001CF70E17|nr:DoxX family protein [Echinicola marina]